MESRERVLKAQKLTKLSVELSGALGKRTRFQSFDLPQLVLLAKSDANEGLRTHLFIFNEIRALISL